jgi:hypothetical protein
MNWLIEAMRKIRKLRQYQAVCKSNQGIGKKHLKRSLMIDGEKNESRSSENQQE